MPAADVLPHNPPAEEWSNGIRTIYRNAFKRRTLKFTSIYIIRTPTTEGSGSGSRREERDVSLPGRVYFRPSCKRFVYITQ